MHHHITTLNVRYFSDLQTSRAFSLTHLEWIQVSCCAVEMTLSISIVHFIHKAVQCSSKKPNIIG